MTVSNPENAPQPVVAWQAQLLRRIQSLAAEHSRVQRAGWHEVDPVDGDQQTAWQVQLDWLDSQREHAEQTALSAGVKPTMIEDARELGRRGAQPQARERTRQPPTRDSAAEGFYLDMLGLDLWHLERMAGLAAARDERISTGRWSFGSDPIAAAHFGQNMRLRHQRITVLAAAAHLDAAEADLMWGPGTRGERRRHAVTLSAYDELTLAQEWKSYAHANPDLVVPPYIPTAGGTPTAGPGATPPGPDELIADARALLHTGSLISSAHTGFGDQPGISRAITAAVDTALPGSEASWPGEPETTTESSGPADVHGPGFDP